MSSFFSDSESEHAKSRKKKDCNPRVRKDNFSSKVYDGESDSSRKSTVTSPRKLKTNKHNLKPKLSARGAPQDSFPLSTRKKSNEREHSPKDTINVKKSKPSSILIKLIYI
jgi:hypothetical protein